MRNMVLVETVRQVAMRCFAVRRLDGLRWSVVRAETTARSSSGFGPGPLRRGRYRPAGPLGPARGGSDTRLDDVLELLGY